MKFFLLFIFCIHVYYGESVKLMSELNMQELHKLHTEGKCQCADHPEKDSKPPPNARFTSQNFDIQKIINIPKTQQQVSMNIESKVRDQMKGLNSFPGEQFRFAYEHEDTSVVADEQLDSKAKGWAGRFPYWFLIPFIWASASSFFIWWPFWWCWFCIWIFWPAHAFVRYFWSAWISRGFHSKDDEQWWKGGFMNLRRVNHFWIVWIFSPGKYKFLYSPNNQEYTNKNEQWHDSRDQWVRWLISRFWFWRYYFCWHIQLIHKEEPYMVKSIKIEMKDPMCFFFGIYQIWPWTRRWNVLLQSQVKSENPECLAVADGSISRDGALVVVQDCVEAISQLDGREFWVYETSMQISHFKTGKCVETAGGDIRDNNRIQIYNCFWTNMAGDSRDKWLLDEKGKISLVKDQAMCLMATADAASSNLAQGATITASSCIPDTEHVALRIIDGTDSYWASAPNEPQAVISLFFDGPRTAKNVEIFWKYPPESFEISALTAVGGWMILSSVHGNSAMSHKADMGVRTIFGVKINCLKLHPLLGKFRDKLIFGITKITMLSGTKNVKLKKCSDGEEGLATNWNLIESYYYNDWGFIPYVQNQKLMVDNVMQMLKPLNELLALEPWIKKAKEKGQGHRQVLETIEQELRDLDIRMTIYKSYLERPSIDFPPGECFAASPPMAAKSCAKIRKIYPFKFSGFYWVKPSCGKMALRVFCDFQIHNNAFYAYVGSIGDGPPISNLIRRREDIGYQCARIGLEPLEILNTEMIRNLMAYLDQIQIKTQKEAIPLGYDWSCRKQCSGRYGSLNNEQSPDVTASFAAFLDKDNLLNQKFTSGTFTNKNTAGIGLSSKGIMFYPFDELPVKGILCSANKEESNDVYVADCFTMVLGNDKLAAIWHTQFKVYCPAGCAGDKTAEVWGDTVYRDDSSICRAAIHAGAMEDSEPAEILLEIETGRNSYEGNTMRGIETKPSKGAEGSFIVNKLIENCPIDLYRDRAKKDSFLEFSEYSEENTKSTNTRTWLTSFLEIVGSSSEIEMKEPNDKEIQSYIANIDRLKSFGNELMNANYNSVRQMSFAEVMNLSPNASEPGKITDYKIEPGSKFTRIPDHMDDETEDANSDKLSLGQRKEKKDKKKKKTSDSKDDDKEDEKEEDKKDGEKITSTVPDSDAAKAKLDSIYTLDYRAIRNIVHLIKDSEKLIAYVNTQIIPILSSNIGPSAINSYHEMLEVHSRGGFSYENRLLIRANARVKEDERILALLELERSGMNSYKKYVEEYKFPIHLAYEIYDHPSANGGPSNWADSRKSMDGHTRVILQTSGVKYPAAKNGGASYCILRFRKYFDGKIKLSFMAAEAGTFGVVFRFKSPFDHYLFELSGESKTKRFKKISKGVTTLLGEVKDGGFLQVKWFKIIIELKKSNINIKFGEESMSDETLESVFSESDDQEFSLGRVGFMVNGLAGLFIDKFEIEPSECVKSPGEGKEVDPNDPNGLYNFDYIEPPKCSRFKENYFGQMELRWRHKDPYLVMNGPGRWQFAPGENGPKKVILQSSEVKSTGPDQGGSLLEFMGPKLCIDGSVMLDLYALSDGVIGVAFRYRNRANHYLAEVGGQFKKFVRLRKVINGKYSLMEINNDIGFDIKKWYTMRISFTGYKIILFFYEKGGKVEDVLPVVEDDELREGTWALSTFLTPGAFDNIRTFPNSDITDNPEDRSSDDGKNIMGCLLLFIQMN